MWVELDNKAVWNKDGRTEVYNENALYNRIRFCVERLSTEKLDAFNRAALRESIKFLVDGLAMFDEKL